MIQVNSTADKPLVFALGQSCQFAIERQDPEVEIRAFIRHQSIFYLQPLSDWARVGKINLRPEAPGDYILTVQWRSQTGTTGQVHCPFRVAPEIQIETRPQITKGEAGDHLWTSNTWEASLLAGQEVATAAVLRQIVRPGWFVYDIGASIGLHSILLAQLIGQQGHVYCVEPNPLCAYFLRVNLELNRVTNASILPVALLDDMQGATLTLNYYNSNLGITNKSPLYSTKLGQRIMVQSYTFDDLRETLELEKPNLMKLDIEGAEGYTLAGMAKTLMRDRPIVIVEVHGRLAAEQTMQQLSQANYSTQDIASARKFSGQEDLMSWFPEAVVQLIATPN